MYFDKGCGMHFRHCHAANRRPTAVPSDGGNRTGAAICAARRRRRAEDDAANEDGQCAHGDGQCAHAVEADAGYSHIEGMSRADWTPET